MKITAQEIIAQQKRYLTADSDRMARRPSGVTRNAWREQNPVPDSYSPYRQRVVDGQGRAHTLSFNQNGSAHDLWVWDESQDPQAPSHIDLAAPDADKQLSAYQEVE